MTQHLWASELVSRKQDDIGGQARGSGGAMCVLRSPHAKEARIQANPLDLDLWPVDTFSLD